MCEVGLSLDEISYFQKNLKKFAKDKTVFTPITNFHARSYIKSVPWGNVLIISPWNYPFLLSIEPLIDAIAAGNTVVLKPSASHIWEASLNMDRLDGLWLELMSSSLRSVSLLGPSRGPARIALMAHTPLAAAPCGSA